MAGHKVLKWGGRGLITINQIVYYDVKNTDVMPSQSVKLCAEEEGGKGVTATWDLVKKNNKQKWVRVNHRVKE